MSSKIAICEVCGEEYTKNSSSQKYCSKCSVATKKQRGEEYSKRYALKQKSVKQYKGADTLEEKCKEIAVYNKLHGTHYSYGEYTALQRIGRII